MLGGHRLRGPGTQQGRGGGAAREDGRGEDGGGGASGDAHGGCSCAGRFCGVPVCSGDDSTIRRNAPRVCPATRRNAGGSRVSPDRWTPGAQPPEEIRGGCHREQLNRTPTSESLDPSASDTGACTR
ncbi:hypothetical protein FO059_09610 [Tomitella fengzijianii]|uniref:Uncharacterized protein n=1 Tax=Tomitella fengzijianii TaxID=2597660 RepID=A0A516X374_9ACTN|nr:hypothetical protein FO059_09610 [Tomitella fengzijianii]